MLIAAVESASQAMLKFKAKGGSVWASRADKFIPIPAAALRVFKRSSGQTSAITYSCKSGLSHLQVPWRTERAHSQGPA